MMNDLDALWAFYCTVCLIVFALCAWVIVLRLALS
jgi:hypothetical protein